MKSKLFMTIAPLLFVAIAFNVFDREMSATVFAASRQDTSKVAPRVTASQTQPKIAASDSSDQKQNSATEYSDAAVKLVIVLISLLGIIFVLQLYWSNKLDQASYLGKLYKDTVQDIEYKRLAATLTEKFEKQEYRREVMEEEKWRESRPIFPPELEGVYGGVTGSGSGSLPTPEQHAAWIKYKKEEHEWSQKVDAEARQQYRRELSAAQEKAKARAEDATAVDLSVLRGRGAEFVLEFTTVVVIIFAATMLGILRILGTEQIGTLLAAIAGYVLGRATTRKRSESGEEHTRTPISTAELTDLIKVVAGITKSQPETAPPNQNSKKREALKDATTEAEKQL